MQFNNSTDFINFEIHVDANIFPETIALKLVEEALQDFLNYNLVAADQKCDTDVICEYFPMETIEEKISTWLVTSTVLTFEKAWLR